MRRDLYFGQQSIYVVASMLDRDNDPDIKTKVFRQFDFNKLGPG